MTEEQFISGIKKVFPNATEDQVMQIMLLIEQASKDGYEQGCVDSESDL